MSVTCEGYIRATSRSLPPAPVDTPGASRSELEDTDGSTGSRAATRPSDARRRRRGAFRAHHALECLVRVARGDRGDRPRPRAPTGRHGGEPATMVAAELHVPGARRPGRPTRRARTRARAVRAQQTAVAVGRRRVRLPRAG